MCVRSVSVIAAALLLLGLGAWALFGRGGDATDPIGDGEPAPLEVERAPETAEGVDPELETRPPPEAAPASPFPAGAVQGVVVDTADAPVGDVCVRVVATLSEEQRRSTQPEPDPRGEGFVTTSDALGRFGLATKPSDGQQLLFLKTGYEVGVVEPAVFDTPEGRPARIVLRPGGVLEGKVQDADGNGVPVPRITASARSAAGEWTLHRVEGDEEGAFRFRFLPQANASVSVDAFGYAGAHQKVDVGPDTEPLLFTLKRRSLLVRAVDAETEHPIENAGALLQTPDGSFRIGLERVEKTFWYAPYPPGWLRLHSWRSEHVFPHPAGVLIVVAPGYATVRREITRDLQRPPPLIVVEMRRGSPAVALGGRIVGGAGATLEVRTPRPANWIDSGDANLPLLTTVSVEVDGAFAIRGLPPGRYRLVVKAEDAAAKGLDVVAPATDLRIDLSPAGAIEVEVAPPTVTWVHLEQPGGRTHWTQQSDEQGRARFEGLPPGRYRATIRHRKSPGRLFPREWIYVPVRADLDLGAGDERKVTLAVPTRRPFALVIVDENGSGREGVRARFNTNPGSYAELIPMGGVKRRGGVHTGADGRIELEIFPGAYGVELTVGPQKRLTWIHVERDGPPTQTIVLPRQTRRIAGLVLDADTSAPITGRRVEAVQDQELYEMLGYGHTDERGHFEIEGVPAQPIRLMVIANLNPTRGPVKDNPYGGAWIRVDLTKAPVPDLTFRLQATAAWLKEAGSVALTVAAKDAATQRPLFKGSVGVETLRDGAWAFTAYGRLGDDGRTAEPIAVPRGERYRIRVSGPFEADPPYARQIVERTAEGEGLHVEVAMEREGGD